MPKKVRPVVYMILNACHGFLYGTLYAPVQALVFGLSFDKMLAWIMAGLPWDLVHGVSNFFCAVLVMPLVNALRMAERNIEKN